jgi:uncharacterized SAM-binding protein YcdF (DUF218 family)
MRLVVKVVLLVLVLVLAYPAWLAYRIWDQSHDDQVHTADTIVVLGAAQYDGEPSPVLKARLDQALYLYQEDLADSVIVTGGKQEGDRFTEAKAGEMYLIGEGVPAERILLEEEGSTTWESLQGVKDIADDNGYNSALFVSDPLHTERIHRMASDLGFDGVYTSFANYERLKRSRATKLKQLVHEVGSLLMYEVLKR